MQSNLPRTDEQRIRRLRRNAERQDLRVVKIDRSSRWYRQYGPIQLVDRETNGVIAHGLDIDEAEDWIGA